MIYCPLEHLPRYFALSPLLPAAFAYLQAFDPAGPDGEAQLRGESLHTSVQSFDTLEETAAIWEAHRRYVDLQYVFAGRERLSVMPAEQALVAKPYDERRDAWFATPGAGAVVQDVVLPPGHLVLLLPHDVHRARCRATPGRAERVRKVVLKIGFDTFAR
jgi:YhcH/YjgK/YiaL family protein